MYSITKQLILSYKSFHQKSRVNNDNVENVIMLMIYVIPQNVVGCW